MFAADTILALKDPKDPDPETDEPFAYNRVRVVGPSPVVHMNVGEEHTRWEGQDAQGVIVAPVANFGGVLDEPYGKLRALYDVESEPDQTREVKQTVRIIDPMAAGPTPEEVFAAEAPGKAPEPGEMRARSPLPEVRASRKSASPLDSDDE